MPFRWRAGHTTLYPPEPDSHSLLYFTGIDRRGAIGVLEENDRLGNVVLRSADRIRGSA